MLRLALRVSNLAEERHRIIGVLYELIIENNKYLTEALINDLSELRLSANESDFARDRLLEFMANHSVDVVASLARCLARFSFDAEGEHVAREVILQLLNQLDNDSGVNTQLGAADSSVSEAINLASTYENHGKLAIELAESLLLLNPDAEDMWKTCQYLLDFLAGQSDDFVAEQLVGLIIQLARATDNTRKVKNSLHECLTGQISTEVAAKIAKGIANLAATAHDKYRACRTLVDLLRNESSFLVATDLVDCAIELSESAEEKRFATARFLEVLQNQTSHWVTSPVLDAVVKLAITNEDKRHVRRQLLLLLSESTTMGDSAAVIVDTFMHLAPTFEEKTRAFEHLFKVVNEETNEFLLERQSRGLIQLATTDQLRQRVRQLLLKKLAQKPDCWSAAHLAFGVPTH